MLGTPSHSGIHTSINPRLYVPDETTTTTSGPFEIGHDFTVDSDGFVTHIRYWSEAASGTVKVKLWDTAGTTELIRATVVGPPVTGWAQQKLSYPYRLTKGKSYTVSRNVPASDALRYLASGLPFTAVPIRVTGGRQISTEDAWMTTAQSTKSYVDIIFVTAP